MVTAMLRRPRLARRGAVQRRGRRSHVAAFRFPEKVIWSERAVWFHGYHERSQQKQRRAIDVYSSSYVIHSTTYTYLVSLLHPVVYSSWQRARPHRDTRWQHSCHLAAL